MADLPFDYSDGDELPASAINQILASRTGDIKPIDDTTRNYTDGAGGLGDSTYTFADSNVDNIKINGNTISSTNTNGDINIEPDGDGEIVNQSYDAFLCRAFVRFDGTSVDGSNYCDLYGSKNVSYVERLATSRYKVVFENAMPSANYCITTSVGDSGIIANLGSEALMTSDIQTTYVTVVHNRADGNGYSTNSEYNSVAVFW